MKENKRGRDADNTPTLKRIERRYFLGREIQISSAIPGTSERLRQPLTRRGPNERIRKLPAKRTTKDDYQQRRIEALNLPPHLVAPVKAKVPLIILSEGAICEKAIPHLRVSACL